jgi:hypothetical protein
MCGTECSRLMIKDFSNCMVTGVLHFFFPYFLIFFFLLSPFATQIREEGKRKNTFVVSTREEEASERKTLSQSDSWRIHLRNNFFVQLQHPLHTAIPLPTLHDLALH